MGLQNAILSTKTFDLLNEVLAMAERWAMASERSHLKGQSDANKLWSRYVIAKQLLINHLVELEQKEKKDD